MSNTVETRFAQAILKKDLERKTLEKYGKKTKSKQTWFQNIAFEIPSEVKTVRGTLSWQLFLFIQWKIFLQYVSFTENRKKTETNSSKTESGKKSFFGKKLSQLRKNLGRMAFSIFQKNLSSFEFLKFSRNMLFPYDLRGIRNGPSLKSKKKILSKIKKRKVLSNYEPIIWKDLRHWKTILKWRNLCYRLIRLFQCS